MTAPWEQGGQGFAPWMVGGYYTDAQGRTVQVYPDPASPSGYTLKIIGQDGATSFQAGPTPADPFAASNAFQNSPQGQTLQKYNEGLAQQNEWQNNFNTTGQQNQNAYQMGQLGVNQAAQQATAQYNQGQLGVAQGQLGVNSAAQQAQQANMEAMVANAKQQLQLNTGQLGLSTLQLGSQLHGPRSIWDYDRAAAGVAGNPLLSNAVSTWANLTSNQPTGAGAWTGGNTEPMTLGALAHDFGGQGGAAGGGAPMAGMNAAGNATTDQAGGAQAGDNGKAATLGALDEAAKNPQLLANNWWSSKDPTQQQMTLGAWDELGHDPAAVMARYNNSRIKQQVGGSRAA